MPLMCCSLRVNLSGKVYLWSHSVSNLYNRVTNSYQTIASWTSILYRNYAMFREDIAFIIFYPRHFQSRGVTFSKKKKKMTNISYSVHLFSLSLNRKGVFTDERLIWCNRVTSCHMFTRFSQSSTRALDYCTQYPQEVLKLDTPN